MATRDSTGPFRRLRGSLLLQFTTLSLVCTVLSATLVSWYLTTQLDGHTALLEQHGMAMMAGTLQPTDPFAIPNIAADVDRLRWTSFLILSLGFSGLFLGSVGLVWRGWRTIQRQRVHLEESLEEAERLSVEAQHAALAKAQFLAMMSHEIRTPLNGVIGMADLLSQTEQSAEQAEYTEAVRRAGAALLIVINDVLDFSKIEAGEIELESRPFQLRDTVEDVLQLLGPTLSDKTLEPLVHYAAAVPSWVVGDEARVRQVLLNLVSNAVKFTEQGEVMVRVEELEREQNSVRLKISVSDTGVGLPQEKLDTIFEEFVQADASTSRRYGGTGLGLAISKRLVHLMNGEIGVESTEGRGSTFWVTLPCALPATAAPEHPVPHTLEGCRILIVDDNATNRVILEETLREWGALPESQPGGAAALQSLRRAQSSRSPFQAVLVDYFMPGMDGVELARTIRADADFDALPLILLSSAGLEAVSRETRETLFQAALTKPARRSQLMDALVVAIRPSTDAVPAPERRPRPATALRRPERLLIAEDNEVNQRIAQRMVETLGWNADLASNGREVLALLAETRYDLILMDVQMPELDGLETTRLIRAGTDSGPRLPIVAVTAEAMAGDRERCLAAGMDDYLSKPMRLEDLRVVLQRWLGDADTTEVA
ncbi:MAG: response regulator [Chloroflexi bacterium]|nr:response regulator [Chloroflexota bacterium]